MKKRFFAIVTLFVIMLASCFAFIACNKSKGGSGNGGGSSASSNSSSITTPSGGDISKVDVFVENKEYKEFYDVVDKIENAIFATTGVQSNTLTGSIYKSAYKSGKSIEGVTNVINTVFNKLNADEQAGFEPEAMSEMYTTYKSMFASTFSLAKQMGDGITRIKGEKSFYGKVMKLLPTSDSGEFYYVIEKEGNHIYQIIYAPEQVTKIVSENADNAVSVKQEYFAFADIYFVDDNNFSFATLTVWGENEQLAFSYGNSQKKIAYGNLNDTDMLYSLAWADGDLTVDTKQITYNASTEKCKEIAPNFVALYDYIDKSYIKGVINRPTITLTQEEIDEITKIWAEEASSNQGENSPWTFVNNVLVGCDFVNKKITPTETVTIPDGVVMLSADFRVSDSAGIVKNLVIPSSCTQLKKLDSANRWVTVDAKNFCPIIEVQNQRESTFYKFEYIKSSSPLFKTDNKSGTLLTSDNKAFYLFDRQATVYDLSGVELDSNISNQHFNFRHLNQVKKIIANASKFYYAIDGEEKGEQEYKYYYDVDTIYRLLNQSEVDLDVLEIHFGNPPKVSKYNKDTEGDIYDIRDRLTLNITDILDARYPEQLDLVDKVEIRELKIVAEGYKYVLFGGGVGENYNYLTDYTSKNLQSFISNLENENSTKFKQWKDDMSKKYGNNDENFLTFENYYREEYLSGKYPDDEQKYYDELDKYCVSKYILAIRKKYPSTTNYSVIRNFSVGGGAKYIGGDITELDFEAYSIFGNINGKIQTVNLSGDYADIRTYDNVNVDKPYTPITFNISANARFTNIYLSTSPCRNGEPIENEYFYTTPYYILKLPVTQETLEKAENFPLLYRYFGYKERYEEIKENGMLSYDKAIKYEFASSDNGVNALISDYWIKSGATLKGYLDETGSCGNSLTLPADCDTVLMRDVTLRTVGKLSKIVIPDNYKYFNGYYGKKSVIEEEDASSFSWSLECVIKYDDMDPYYKTYQVRKVELTGNSPLFSMSNGYIYSKDGSYELTNFLRPSTDRSDLPTYPGTLIDGENYDTSYLIINQDFINKDLFGEYNFQGITTIVYADDISGAVVIDLETLGLYDAGNVQVIVLQSNNISSVKLKKATNTGPSEFMFVFNCTKAEFESAFSLEKQAMFFNGHFNVPEGYTYEDFKANDYFYCTGEGAYSGKFNFIRFVFADSIEPTYDVSGEGVDMADSGKVENLKGTDVKVLQFYNFANTFSYYVTFPTAKMNYNLGENEKISNMIFYFDCTKDGFTECLTKGDFADFIGWEYLDVGGKTFAEFEADNFTYKNGNNQIKFYFGNMDVNWSDTPSEPQRFVLNVNSGTSKLNFAKKGGAYYCDAVELNTLPTVKITEVDYGLTGDQRISNIMFMFFNMTKQEFLDAYVNEEDVFGFRNTNVFAMALDFSNPTSEDETSILFSQDGETSVFISFSFKAPE